MKKRRTMKKRLNLNKEAVLQLGRPESQQVVGGSSVCSDATCFPDICLNQDSSGC